MPYFAKENRVVRKMENILKELMVPEMGVYFQEDAPYFFLSPSIVWSFDPV